MLQSGELGRVQLQALGQRRGDSGWRDGGGEGERQNEAETEIVQILGAGTVGFEAPSAAGHATEVRETWLWAWLGRSLVWSVL